MNEEENKPLGTDPEELGREQEKASSDQPQESSARNDVSDPNTIEPETSTPPKESVAGDSSKNSSGPKKPDSKSVKHVFDRAKDKLSGMSKKKKLAFGITSGVLILIIVLIVLFATHVICFHDWEPATCTEPETCVICGETRGVKLGHEWSAATCTLPMTCKRCDQKSGSPLGHKVEEWTVVEESTCITPGSKKGVCTVCEEEVTEELPLKEHTPGEWEIVVEATESLDGERVKKCTVCGEVIEEESFSLTPAQIKDNFIKSCQSYSFKDLARNANSLKGKRIKGQGEVVQVLSSGNYYEMRVNVTRGSYGIWTDTVYVTYFKNDDAPNIIEDDVITFYGEIEGTTSYESVLGATITLPDIAAEYIDIN